MMDLIVTTSSGSTVSFKVKAGTAEEATQVWNTFETFKDARKFCKLTGVKAVA